MKSSLLLLGAVLVSACNSSAKSSDAPAPAVEPAQAAVPSGAKATAPRSKDPSTTPAERLGTAPEGTGLTLGAPLPDIEVTDSEGKAAKLPGVAGGRPLLLIFYRGGWCPFCNGQVHELATRATDFEARGVALAIISVDKVDEAAKLNATYKIPFAVLSDPDLAAHTAFRVLNKVDDAQVAGLKSHGMDLEASSGRSHHEIAIPSVFLFDAKGILVWQHVDRDYKSRPRVDQLLGVLDGKGFAKK